MHHPEDETAVKYRNPAFLRAEIARCQAGDDGWTFYDSVVAVMSRAIAYVVVGDGDDDSDEFWTTERVVGNMLRGVLASEPRNGALRESLTAAGLDHNAFREALVSLAEGCSDSDDGFPCDESLAKVLLPDDWHALMIYREESDELIPEEPMPESEVRARILAMADSMGIRRRRPCRPRVKK